MLHAHPAVRYRASQEKGAEMLQRRLTWLCVAVVLSISCVDAQTTTPSPAPANPRIILSGTTIDPETQIRESQELAKKLANPASPQWQAKGDQKRSYIFPGTNAEIRY